MKPLRTGLLPVIMLVVVIAWALFAVAMLTGTLVAAQKIETRVGVINQVYPDVNENLNSIALANETGRIADEISTTVKPIGPQFTQVVDAVAAINANAKSIEGAAATINGSVKTINTSVKDINVTVTSIDSRLTAVNDNAQSINSSVRGIAGHFDDLLGVVQSIDDRVKGINDRADAVIGVAKAIEDDLDETNEVVQQINQNAEAIANSPVVALTSVADLLTLLNSLVGIVPCAPFCDILDITTPASVVPVVPVVPVAPLVAPLPELTATGPALEGLPVAGELGDLPVDVPAPALEEAVPSVPLDGLLGN